MGFVRPTRSPWFSELGNARVRCELCPKSCELAEGERAICRVRENRGGVGYTLAYGNPALIQEDPVERKPFFHVMPGSRALSIATAGCNLECKFCEVWDMALVAPEQVHAYDMPPEAVVAHALAANVRSISYAFGEPVIFYEYMAAVASLAREAGLLNLIHTAGYIQPEPLKELSGKLDAANIDLKSFDPAFYREVVGGELEPVLRTLRLLRDEGVHIEITNIVIPALSDDMEKIGEMCRWIADELGRDVPLHFARFYPLYRLSDLPRTPVSTLDRARNTALEAGLRFVYVARVTGHEGEDTFCPNCGEAVINRVGFVIDEMQLENGKCRYCGSDVPGRWE
jgi:pyruvate formate lyase activating enzyme